MKRRQFVQLIAASSLSTHCVADTSKPALTASQAEGPFYPVTPIPESNNLLLNKNHLGSELQLSGHVFDSTGQPVAAARVEIWQCDGRGVYHHPSAPNHSDFDANFGGAGATTTDNSGRYRFTTIVPVPYTGRPPHIHTKVFINNTEKLTSQIYLRNGGGHKRLKIDLTENAEATYLSTFDFVVKA